MSATEKCLLIAFKGEFWHPIGLLWKATVAPFKREKKCYSFMLRVNWLPLKTNFQTHSRLWRISCLKGDIKGRKWIEGDKWYERKGGREWICGSKYHGDVWRHCCREDRGKGWSENFGSNGLMCAPHYILTRHWVDAFIQSALQVAWVLKFCVWVAHRRRESLTLAAYVPSVTHRGASESLLMIFREKNLF